MQDAANTFDQPLADLPKEDWLAKLAEITSEHGRFTELGDRHFAAFIEGDETLVVTFETVQGMRALTDTAQPVGWDLTKALGWSHLCLASDGDTWFRDPAVWDYMDDLIDEGFFDEYEHVLFYGAGPCGYAATAFSVASPGCTVVAIQPQATLDPRITNWDDRFADERRRDFTSRFGYGPDMLDAAERAFILFDPEEHMDAMHAALYTRPHVTPLRLPHMGAAIQSDLIEMQLLYRVLAQAGSGKLSAESYARLYRARRGYPPYLRRVLAALDTQGRDHLSWMLAENVTRRMKAPRFQRRLAELSGKLGKDDADA